MAPAAHIVHLPSGVKMLMVLVSGMLGAIAITIVGFCYGAVHSFNQNYFLITLLSIASGFSPLIALFFLNKILKLTSNLSNLNWDKLLIIALTYAVINSFSHQIIALALSESTDLVNGLLIMFTGDVTGIFIVLYLFRFGLKVMKAREIKVEY